MMSPSSLVHIIDDDDAARDSLEYLLQSVRIEVRTYDSAASFLRALPIPTSGCIITDVRMPDISGIDLLRRLKETGVATPVIVMTGHGDIQLAVEAMKIGAVDFLEKPFDDETMLSSVKTALARSEQAGHSEAESAGIKERLTTLSGRERDVLLGLLAGKPNKVIAYDLGISPRTVEIYRANVMTKMQAGSLSELVRMALISGILPSPSNNSA